MSYTYTYVLILLLLNDFLKEIYSLYLPSQFGLKKIKMCLMVSF